MLTFALQRKLPYKKMLIVTGVLIGVVLVVMVGQTARTMQGTGWLPITPLDWEIPPSLGLWMGIFPSVETLLAQVAAIAFVIGSYVVATELKVKRPQRRAARRASRAGAGARRAALRAGRALAPAISAQYCADMSTKEQTELLVLVAGPYRGGTGDDPAKLAANVTAMNTAALDVFRAGHLPVTGEALALPLIERRGQRARRRPGVRRDLPPDRPPAAGALRRGAADRRRLGGRGRDGRDRARRRASSSSTTVDAAALMLKEERHRRILELLESEGRLVAADLPERLGVSGHTVRRDLDELADTSSLQRVHGGALARSPVARELRGPRGAGRRRQDRHRPRGGHAARAGQVVILDGGSTALHLVDAIPPATPARSSPTARRSRPRWAGGRGSRS